MYKSFNLFHFISFEKMLFIAKIINYRRNNYNLFKKLISFLHFIQKMNECILNWWIIICGVFCLRKFSNVNVFNRGKNHIEVYISKIWFTSLIMNLTGKGVLVFSNQKDWININTVFLTRQRTCWTKGKFFSKATSNFNNAHVCLSLMTWKNSGVGLENSEFATWWYLFWCRVDHFSFFSRIKLSC